MIRLVVWECDGVQASRYLAGTYLEIPRRDDWDSKVLMIRPSRVLRSTWFPDFNSKNEALPSTGGQHGDGEIQCFECKR